MAALAKLDKREYWTPFCISSLEDFCLYSAGITTTCNSTGGFRSTAAVCYGNCRCAITSCGSHICKEVDGVEEAGAVESVTASTTEAAQADATAVI